MVRQTSATILFDSYQSSQLSELSSAGKQTAPKKRKTTTGSHALKKGAKEISFSQIKREVEELGNFATLL